MSAEIPLFYGFSNALILFILGTSVYVVPGTWAVRGSLRASSQCTGGVTVQSITVFFQIRACVESSCTTTWPVTRWSSFVIASTPHLTFRYSFATSFCLPRRLFIRWSREFSLCQGSSPVIKSGHEFRVAEQFITVVNTVRAVFHVATRFIRWLRGYPSTTGIDAIIFAPLIELAIFFEQKSNMFASPSFWDSVFTARNDSFLESCGIVVVVVVMIANQLLDDISAMKIGDIIEFFVILDGHNGVDTNCSGSGEDHCDKFHLSEVWIWLMKFLREPF